MCKRLICLLMPFLLLGPTACATALAADPMAGLVGWWPLNEDSGTTAFDRSGNENNGTLTNGPVWATGILDGALQFDGVDDIVVAGSTGRPSDTFSFGAWLKTTATHEIDSEAISGAVGVNNQRYAFDPRHGGDNDGGAGLSVGTNGLAVYEHGSNYMPATATYPTELGEEWNHVMIVYLDKQPTIFLNGVAVHTGLTSPRAAVHAPIQFGGMAYGYLEGLMDDIRIYDRALSSEEIAIIMTGYAGDRAYNPQPADETADVPRDVVLAWDPMQSATTRNVYFGTAFDDVNDASRTDPMDVLLSQGQVETTFALPETLAFDTTYYWRIDEVNAPPDGTVYKGTVWSFTTESFAYPIEDIVATSNGTSQSPFTPERTVDGSGLNADDQHSAKSSDMWRALPPADETLYIQYAFDRLYKLHQLLVWNYNVPFESILGFGLKDVTIEYSENGTDWTVLADVELAQAPAGDDYAANTIVDLQEIAAQYVRLLVNSAWGEGDEFGLSEVRFLYIPVHARDPEPADGAAHIGLNATLTWRAGRDAESYDLYFGSDAEAVALASTVTDNAFTPGPLIMATTYYWQIDTLQAADTWPGPLWSFTTEEYLLVDDFESYTDDIEAGETIFDTWIDGWVNGSGSTVGYLEAPFAEQTTVRNGDQAMPLFYDNTSTDTSEATANVTDLQGGRDWTQHGIQRLSLYFHGAADNTPAQLYLKIDDTRIDYDGPADDLTNESWLAWTVELTAVADLENVAELTIGIEGAGAEGVLYIDDVELYP